MLPAQIDDPVDERRADVSPPDRSPLKIAIRYDDENLTCALKLTENCLFNLDTQDRSPGRSNLP